MIIEELRNNIIIVQDLNKTDLKYTIFYDETNNCRKFYLRDTSFNTNPCVFVLAGIATHFRSKYIDPTELKKILKIQKTAKEIKHHHIVKGSLEQILTSEKLKLFLNWLNSQDDIFIHYSAIDLFYFSTVDIIDSIISPESVFFVFCPKFKSDLYQVLKLEEEETIKLFNKYKYPAISNYDKNEFISKLVEIVQNSKIINDTDRNMLKGILQQAISIPSLVFIEGNRYENLVDDFATFYFHQLIVLKNSRHLFDKEQKIEETFNEISFLKNISSNRNFDFIDSSASIEIQISDVIAYIFGVIFTDILRMTKQNISALKTDIRVQKNVKLLRELVHKSEQENKAFLHHCLSIYDYEKFCFLLS